MTVQTTVAHDDDVAVQVFANAMCRKLKLSREKKGRSGWQHVDTEELAGDLIKHLIKGDMVDVANYAMFIASQRRGIRRRDIRKAARWALQEFLHAYRKYPPLDFTLIED